MKRILTYLLLASATVVVNADNWVRDTEPGMLEVHYIPMIYDPYDSIAAIHFRSS